MDPEDEKIQSMYKYMLNFDSGSIKAEIFKIEFCKKPIDLKNWSYLHEAVAKYAYLVKKISIKTIDEEEARRRVGKSVEICKDVWVYVNLSAESHNKIISEMLIKLGMPKKTIYILYRGKEYYLP